MSERNTEQAAFIICVNDWKAYEECLFYLNRLHLPAGFEKDIITIQDAPSMAAGYNAGMNSSDAKYKIYMHQDVHILNQNFIIDIVGLFKRNPDIGMMGCIGASHLGKEAMAVTSWDTGKILHNHVPMCLEYDEIKGDFSVVTALDGLLLASQYDLSWREDLMDGWDFYDISQCMEFARAGYKIAVPRQEVPWCYHDNQSSSMTRYHFYRRKFIEEYGADGTFEMQPEWESSLEYQKLKQQAVQMIEHFIDGGEHEQLYEIFQDERSQQHLHLKEYNIISNIDYLERQSGMESSLWRPGACAAELLQRVRQLKCWMKRIEHQAADVVLTMDQIMAEFSVYAAAEIFVQYVIQKKHTFYAVKRYFAQRQLKAEADVWELLQKCFISAGNEENSCVYMDI